MDNSLIARLAFTEAQDERELNNLPKLGPDHFERAEALVEMGFSYLKARDELDPRVWAKDLGEFAVLEWVKSKLSGQNPELSTSFMAAMDRWRRRAMSDFHRGGPRSPFQIRTKDPDTKQRFSLDYETWLGGATITDSEWIIPTGLMEISSAFTDTDTEVLVEGGQEHNEYELTNRITVSDGRTEDRTIKVIVVER